MPLVVLVEDNTASASEIVAGAFQDNDRDLIVGERTIGKGLVQSVIDLPGKTGLTLTAARYLTPSGRSIQRDYSKIDRYDYFNHKDAAIDQPYFEARTVTDRKVFGGDGILPDDVIKNDDPDAGQAALLDTIFLFTREAAAGRVAGCEQYRSSAVLFGKRVLPGELPVSAAMWAAFKEFAIKTSNNPVTSDSLDANETFIKTRLRYNLVMASFGSTSADQVLAENDPQVAKAIEVIPQAAQLTQTAARMRRTADK
jgi:carboxyl-terminal processing protease